MAIDSTITEVNQCVPKYPYLGKSDNGFIVLFHSPGSGVVVCITAETPALNRLGTYSDHWNEYVFEPFDGTVTLKNF